MVSRRERGLEVDIRCSVSRVNQAEGMDSYLAFGAAAPDPKETLVLALDALEYGVGEKLDFDAQLLAEDGSMVIDVGSKNTLVLALVVLDGMSGAELDKEKRLILLSESKDKEYGDWCSNVISWPWVVLKGVAE